MAEDTQREYIYNKKSLVEQFQIFCKENNPKTFEIATEFFSVFGGLNRKVDCNDNINKQIQEHILKRYKYLRNDISAITNGDQRSHLVLSGLALGDRRTNSAFKRTKMSFDDGIDIVDDLCDLGMLKLEKTFQRFTNKPYDDSISEKLIFTTPFAHFWFAFVSPIFKGIRDGDFTESLKNYENKKIELTSFVFDQLCQEMLKKSFEKDTIKEMGRYWDNSSNIIDLLAKTKSGKVIAGSIKYTNNKVKKTELNKLKENCTKLGIQADIFVLFSKNGYTSELKSCKSDTLQLFSLRNLSLLVSSN